MLEASTSNVKNSELKKYPAIVRVLRVIGENPETKRVQAIIASWDSRRRVTLPFNILPPELQNVGIKPLTRLGAKVNYKAEKAHDLDPEDFRLLPDPKESDNELYQQFLARERELNKTGWWEELNSDPNVIVRRFPDRSIHEIEITHKD